ncbi:beta-ketoacyl synthase N-terminal-like domain-containing protein [Streptomyces sp. NPDC091272]|uniref:beta-ketoacyl synthase N-terminal-like domain-containing protein n=1 Tax=Streptomyces sp. NPDC091272 TaxID=3365981 RepID=UPI00381E6A65
MPAASVPDAPAASPPLSAPLDIAVVGVSALVPGSQSVTGFWRTVASGRDLMREVPPSHWLVDDYYDSDPDAPDRTYATRGAFLDPVDFHPMAYGIPPKMIPATDTTQLLALMTAELALSDAFGKDLSSLDKTRTGVILGASGLEQLSEMGYRLQRPVWRKAMREHGMDDAEADRLCDAIADHYTPWQEASFPGLLSNVVAGRIANRFDLNGPNCTVDAACAGSLAALSMAVSELQLGKCDTVLTGGVDTFNGIAMYMCFSKTPALSRSGDCRPLSDTADGTMLGEGLVMFALRRLADAQRDGNPVYAVLKGIGSSSDGRGGAIYAPVPRGQKIALERAYQQAGYGPSTVELVEAHGTGTKAGDAAELTALIDVFGQDRPEGRDDEPWCAVGSVKSQLGHTKSAAGAVGLLKAVLALHQGAIPPTIKVSAPSELLAERRSPLYASTELRPWVRDSRHPRRASVSSFGFGGSNFHVTAEEYRPDRQRSATPMLRTTSSELLLLGAGSSEELAAAALKLSGSTAPLAEDARAGQLSFDAGLPYRLAVLASDRAQAVERLRSLAEHLRDAPERSVSHPGRAHYAGPVTEPGRIAFLFSGQGSQYVGMGAALALHSPQALAVWDQAADWGAELGCAPHRLVFPPPAVGKDAVRRQARELAQTDNAQPALAVQCLAQLSVLTSLGLRPDCTGGHSFGELVALHAAGVYDGSTLFRLAVRRGELMAEAGAAQPGGMLAVECSADRLLSLLGPQLPEGLWLVSHNAPEQVVLAGEHAAVQAAADALGKSGVPATRLATGAAFHSPAVAAAATPFDAFLDVTALRPPRIDVWSNANAQLYPREPGAVRRLLGSQMVSPVRFAEQVEAMWLSGVRDFVELGAGGALTRLVSRNLGDRPHLAVAVDQRGSDGFAALQDALARLTVHRARPLDLTALWAPFADASAAPTGKPAGRGPTVAIRGSNYGKPYPPAGSARDRRAARPQQAAVGAATGGSRSTAS